MNNTLQEIVKKKYPATNSERLITLTERALSEIRKQEFISGMEQSVGGLIENLKKIEQMSDPGSHERAIVEMKRLATEALSSFKEGKSSPCSCDREQLEKAWNDGAYYGALYKVEQSLKNTKGYIKSVNDDFKNARETFLSAALQTKAQ